MQQISVRAKNGMKSDRKGNDYDQNGLIKRVKGVIIGNEQD
jgi:hypothetical protein